MRESRLRHRAGGSLIALGVSLAAGLSACGGSPAEREASRSGASDGLGSAPLPECAGDEPAIMRPAGVPADLPLPPGVVLTSAQHLPNEAVQIDGVMPGDHQAAARFWFVELPKAGYELLESEGEEDEAESYFAGNGVQGWWRARDVVDCKGASTLTMILSPLAS